MGRLQVTELDLGDLPLPCRDCVFWEAGGPPGPDLPPDQRARARAAKEAWWRTAALEWGHCGHAVWDGRRLRGYSLFAPAGHLEGATRFGRVTEDALLLALLWTEPPGDEGVARLLVEEALKAVAVRGARALEAFGSPRSGQPCLVHEAILRSCGFALLRRGFPYPHYRLDLRQTARWRDAAEEALAQVRRSLRGRSLRRVPSLPSTRLSPRAGLSDRALSAHKA